MRKELNSINMRGKIVIGEGELDEAPMLYINEEVGTKNGEEYDIAVDPLEGTNFTAKNLPNALSVLAVTRRGNLLHAPGYLYGKNCYRTWTSKEFNRFGSRWLKKILNYLLKQKIQNLKN